jgi:hypothetical protein
MNHALRMIPFVAAIVAAVMAAAPAVAASSDAPPPAATAAATKFARIARDADGRPSALQLAIVTYASGTGLRGVSVDLISAVHVGDAAYYRALNERFRDYDALLYEMIIPDDASAAQESPPGTNFISGTQIGMKNMLGLEFQLDGIDYDAANFVHADLTSGELAQSMEDRGESLYVYFWRLVFAGIDDYARDPLGLNDWRLLSSIFSSDENALKIAIAYEMVRASATSDILAGENGSAVIAARNEHAVRVLQEQMAGDAQHIGIFYGVGHMADFEQRLHELAFARTEIEWIDAWSFPAGREKAP